MSSSLNSSLCSQCLGWWGFCFHSLCSGTGTREKKEIAKSEELDLQAKEFLPPKEGEPCWTSHFPFRACLSLRLTWPLTSRAPPGLRVRKGKWRRTLGSRGSREKRDFCFFAVFCSSFLSFSSPPLPFPPEVSPSLAYLAPFLQVPWVCSFSLSPLHCHLLSLLCLFWVFGINITNHCWLRQELE